MEGCPEQGKGITAGTGPHCVYEVTIMYATAMKKRHVTLCVLALFILSTSCHAGFLDDVLKGLSLPAEEGLSTDTIVSGLKEALMTGTENAVKEVSKKDGYLGNDVIKILMPEKMQTVADMLSKVGYERQVDDFIGSMNRAAEQAAPKAVSYFVESISGMSFDDARRILDGGDTAATDFFKSKMFDRLYAEFSPAVSASMNDVGVTRSYKTMMDTYNSLPFVSKTSFNIDDYVTNNALDGLFFMVAEEEKKIRTDPGARVTDLLKKVFSK